MTLDEELSAFAGCLDAERGAVFKAGDRVLRVLAAQKRAVATPRAFRKMRWATLGMFAAAGHCTRTRVAQVAAVSACFDADHRYPDVAWPLFHACVRAAEHTNRDAVEILDEALAQGWHVPQVNALWRTAKARGQCGGTCRDCGAKCSAKQTEAAA